MQPYINTATITIYTIAIVSLIFLICLRTSPFPVASQFVRHLVSSKRYVFMLITVLFILVMNRFELQVEQALAHNLDFTPWVYSVEGSVVKYIQDFFEHQVVTAIVAFFYVIVFPALLIASIGIYTYTKQYALYYALLIAVLVNYIVAIPFYLYFPVAEIWSYEPSGVRFLMLDVYSNFEATYRNMSGLDNCFPSLHTSLSVTLALVAGRSSIQSWRWIAGISAVIVIFSIFYLGIHWMLDMLAGAMLGWLAVQIGLRITEKLDLANKTLVAAKLPSA